MGEEIFGSYVSKEHTTTVVDKQQQLHIPARPPCFEQLDRDGIGCSSHHHRDGRGAAPVTIRSGQAHQDCRIQRRHAAHTAHRSTHRAPVHRESQREWRAEHRGKSTEQSTRTEYEDGQQIARRAERCCLALSARAAVYAAVAGFLAEILVRRRGATHQSVIGLNQIAAKCSETRYALRFHGSMGVLAEVDAISRPKLGEWNDQSLKTIDVVKSLTLIQYYAVSLALWYHCMH